MYSTCFLEALVLKIKINRLASRDALRAMSKDLEIHSLIDSSLTKYLKSVRLDEDDAKIQLML